MKEKIKQRAIKYFLIFLAVMLVLTFVSRMVYTERMPRVSCMQIKDQSISHEFEYAGTVEALKSQPVFVPEGLRIIDSKVNQGDRVIKSQLIMKLDIEYLHRKAAMLEKEIAEQLESASAYFYEGSIPVFTEAGLRIAEVCVKAGDSVYAGQKLLRLDGEHLGRRIADLQNEINADISTRDGYYDSEDQRSAEAISNHIDEKQRELDRYTEIYNNGCNVYSSAGGVVTGVPVKAGDVTTDSAVALISSDPSVSCGLSEKQEMLEELRKLDEKKGCIYSPTDGVITAKNASIGEFTAANAVFIVSDISEGIVFRTNIEEKDLRYISVGDVFKLKFRNGKINAEGCEVKRITKTADGSGYTVELTLQSDKLEAGEVGYLKGTVLSEEKYSCVPLNAIHFVESDVRGEIFVAEETEGFFGKEYTAKKYSVTIREKNDADAGIEDLGLSPNSKVIVSSSKKLYDGQKIRI
ncbi:MAG: HlyD family efflux transporter periplasmic adaptor subunit [Ruminococcus sp.]|uniref:efflux RND transporter periplasmic adaptor subunit n=1 Tax=Ruminococcus sp. TaxID=41978 RepID=UPI0025E6BD54|nr:HlyD family efflux transporter periplasmic adaptor subunit [Ruminococcus sp.]MCR4795091.1 HlyD family efflux transporter periplasmic adaptor subunit [Ruminococcus sp.]